MNSNPIAMINNHRNRFRFTNEILFVISIYMDYRGFETKKQAFDKA